MRDFLRNLAILAVIAVVLFIVAPGMMKQALGLYNGLGLIPILIVLVLLAALPSKKSRRRR